MRLKDTLNLLQEQIPKLSGIKYEPLGGNVTRISNLQEGMLALSNLTEISAFIDDIDNIAAIPEFNNLITDKITIPVNLHTTFAGYISSIITKGLLLQKVLEKQIPQNDLDSFNILLPKLKSFTEYSSFFNEMDKIVLRPLNGESKIEITSFDVGSEWINIAIDTAIGSIIFAFIIRLGFELFTKDYHQYKLKKTIIKSFQAGQKAQEEFLKINNERYVKALEEKTENCFNEINNNCPEFIKNKSDSDIKEYKTNLKFSLEQMSKFIDKGMEVYVAIENSKKNIIPSIPNFKDKKKLIEENQQKLLEGNSESDGE